MAQRRFEAGIPHSQGRGPRASFAGNPYAKRPQTNGGATTSGGEYHANKVTRIPGARSSAPGGPPRRVGNYTEAQHPHRTGRVRVDRQFSSNVSIFASQGEGTRQRAEAVSAGMGQMDGIQSLLSDGDSDEDDELMSFTPFSKKQKN